MITIELAKKEQDETIASFIMEAMTHECCQWFIGPEARLEDFHLMMTDLVKRDDSQYSYLNTLVAVNEHNEVVGACVSYDGGELKERRETFISCVKERFGRDFSNMPAESSEGELYIDSLCTNVNYRGKGIATKLLNATIEKAKGMGLPAGLLVDVGNPRAERLYTALGFEFVNENEWGGHKMRHLQIGINKIVDA